MHKISPLKLAWVGHAGSFVVTFWFQSKFATNRSLRHFHNLQTDQNHPHYKTDPWFQRSPPIHMLIPFQGTTCFESHFVVSRCLFYFRLHSFFTDLFVVSGTLCWQPLDFFSHLLFNVMFSLLYLLSIYVFLVFLMSFLFVYFACFFFV